MDKYIKIICLKFKIIKCILFIYLFVLCMHYCAYCYKKGANEAEIKAQIYEIYFSLVYLFARQCT